jgi:DNA-binding beta-propeller fold protein YncE
VFTRIALAVLACIALLPLNATAWDRGSVERFATLPAEDASSAGRNSNPEGIAVDKNGDVYVSTFAVHAASGPGKVFVFGANGALKRELQVSGSSQLLLGIDFHPKTGELLVIDFGHQQVLSVNANTGAASLFAQIPGGANAGPNALAFDAADNVYISDSFQGVIWRTSRKGGTPVAWASGSLLTTSGFPPFGANGMGFNSDGSSLFVANTGNDTVVRIPVSAGVAGTPEVFVNAINGADGLIVDANDNLWICANQADEIVVLDKTGKAIAKLGDFNKLTVDGAPNGLLFPASLARSGDSIYITNLSLDLRLFGLAQSGDSQWAAQVTRHTISRIRARIP